MAVVLLMVWSALSVLAWKVHKEVSSGDLSYSSVAQFNVIENSCSGVVLGNFILQVEE